MIINNVTKGTFKTVTSELNSPNSDGLANLVDIVHCTFIFHKLTISLCHISSPIHDYMVTGPQEQIRLQSECVSLCYKL